MSSSRSFSRWMFLVLSFAALCSARTSGQAARPTPAHDLPASPIFQANARTVVVNVVVTDKNGKPAKGLRQEDFLVAEDGHPQRVTSFDEHSGEKPGTANLPPLPANVFTNIPRVTPSDSFIVLVFDALNTDLQSQLFVRREMFKYLANPVPGRRTAIFTLGNRLSLIQGFTDDPGVLAEAIKKLSRGAAPQSSTILQSRQEIDVDQRTIANMAESDPTAAAALQRFQQEVTVTQTSARVDLTLAAFQQLAQYLSGIPGRKNVVWFSGAFPSVLFPGLDSPWLVLYGDRIRKADALLAAAQASLYPVAAEGLANDSLYDVGTQFLGAHSASDAQQQQNKSLQDDTRHRNADHTTMDEVARDTGGQAYYNTNGLSQALTQVAERDSSFYTLSYTPTNTTRDGQLRKIQVKLANGGYKLAYRRVYYAADAKAEAKAAAKAKSDPLAASMGPWNPVSTQIPIAVRVTKGATRPGDNGRQKGPTTRYSVDIVIAERGLQLNPNPDGSRTGGVEAALVVYDQNGKPVNGLTRELNLDMTAARYTEVQASGVNFRLEIDVPPEAVSLRAGIYDHNSKQVGTVTGALNSGVSAPAPSAKVDGH